MYPTCIPHEHFNVLSCNMDLYVSNVSSIFLTDSPVISIVWKCFMGPRYNTGCLNKHGTHATVKLFLLTQYIYIYIGCLDIHGTHVTAQLFLLTLYMYIYIGCLNKHGTHATVQLFLLTQYMYVYIYIYRVSRYTWDPCDCPIISAHSVYVYIQGV